jgi:hypothetical protein
VPKLIRNVVDTALRIKGNIDQAAGAVLNSLVEVGKMVKGSPFGGLASLATRGGKWIPVLGVVAAAVNVGTDWDNKNPWGNTRNLIGAGIAGVEAASGAMTGLVLIPGLQPIGVGAGVVASFSSIGGIAWDVTDLAWDVGEENFW